MMHSGRPRSGRYKIGAGRYAPYDYGAAFSSSGTTRILAAREEADTSEKLRLFADHDITVEREEEHPTGSVMRRDMALERQSSIASSPPRHTLPDCSRRGIIDMIPAAKILHNMKTRRTFSEGSYKEFVRHVATNEIRELSFKMNREIQIDESTTVLLESFQLMADILLAKVVTLERKILTSLPEPRSRPPSQFAFRVSNCTKSWILEPEQPFTRIDLVELSLTWTQKRRATDFAQALSLFRFLLKKLTEPSERIKEYAVRLNGRSGKDAALKNLPEHVEHVLLDFAEDMLGYGRDELKPCITFDRSKSRFYMDLGRTDEERDEALENLAIERSLWRNLLLKSLQRALSDLRSRTHWTEG